MDLGRSRALGALGLAAWVGGCASGAPVPVPVARPVAVVVPPRPEAAPVVAPVRPKVVVADAARCRGGEEALVACFAACGKLDESACGSLSQTCEEGDARACAFAGSVVEASRPRSGEGPARMLRYYELSCTGGWSGSCARLANIYAQGVPGVSPDGERVEAYAKKLMDVARADCARGDANGCMTIGNGADKGFGVARDPAAAKVAYARGYKLMQAACDRRESSSCRLLGIYYDEGLGTPVDKARARRMIERACAIPDKEQETSCLLLKQMFPGQYAPR